MFSRAKNWAVSRKLRKRNTRPRSKTRLQIQTLKRRELLAADIDFSDGELEIEGSGDSEFILVGYYDHFFESDGQPLSQDGEYFGLPYAAFSPDSLASIDLDHIVVFEFFSSDVFVSDNFYGVQSIDIELKGGDDGVFNLTAIDSVISGGDGNDTLWGGFGHDVLVGGDGSDDLRGHAFSYPHASDSAQQSYFDNYGITALTLENDHDELFGGDGNDQLLGGAGNDFLDGGAGDEILYGGAGNDTMIGGDGHDEFDAGSGDDTLYGGAGNDHMIGGEGDDTIDGGDGLDRIFGDFRQGWLIFGDSVIDQSLNLPFGSQGGNDTLIGGDDVDMIQGGGGDDWIYGDFEDNSLGTFYDYLDGGAGNDHIFGGGGYDFITGDSFIISSGYIQQITMATGNDTIHGGAGTDSIWGENGNDLIYGDEDFDTLFGGKGADEIFTGSGGGIGHGGAGDDKLHGSDDIDLFRGGEGHDEIFGGGNADSLWGEAGDDIIHGGDGNDEIDGGDGNDIIHGGNGDDLIWGWDGDDTLFGEAGDDTIYGDKGNDILDGGDGNDYLRDGAQPNPEVETDEMYGGAGENQFNASPEDLVDTDGEYDPNKSAGSTSAANPTSPSSDSNDGSTTTSSPSDEPQSLGELAYKIDQELGLSAMSTRYNNRLGLGEKWMQGDNGDQYYITKDGTLYLWNGSKTGTGSEIISRFDATYFNDLALIYNAQDPATRDSRTTTSR
ncbi:calcium-binding protein [Aporhodopirellula aestuarii]|uniref:Cyclic nucleotide-binding domain-containing protein n=1 Tax=Aporhodopirellula aestuarii TaxID=2950107 RepID=A0ABT0UFT0_9BACT|nr:hypothetical protein [Aporhodopirellula aestuarii]MCM2374951.1 hypothetical protein [Aporhodopirellula aestuarii]